ncbi:U-box domain-containing protein 19-like [Fagus crenata]
MIQRFNRTDRRALTFPAVHPCEGVSPETLLSSLITLSHNICNYQSKFFATQRRNARETIREIGILRILFEEIRDLGLNLSESVVLCFSELHLTFQKINYLLEDCAREGSRLWMLMKSEFVATQFRVLIREVSTALDVMPLSLIDVSGEVKELVELVAKQACKAKFELDTDDEQGTRLVLSILDQFKKGIEPEFRAIKRVLDYLGIKKWSDCNKEIKFLEEVTGVQCTDCDEREVPFLSSLVGFMNYCRGVIFEALDNRNSDQTDVRCNLEPITCLNPEDFRCPISLELMVDPVTVSTGQTYDRCSIQKWLKAGNMLCPKTGEKLKSTELVPNTSLRKLIQQFCNDNGISLDKSRSQSRDITRTIVPGSPVAAETMRYLSKFLARKLVFGTIEQKNKAAYEIRLLAKSNIFNRSCLIEACTIPSLLNLLSLNNTSTQENAIAALLKLSKHTIGKREIMENGGLKLILEVLSKGLSLEAKQTAAATLFYLSSEKEYRKLIGKAPEAIPGLVELIKAGTSCGKKNAVVAIFGLLLYPKNNQRVLAAGTVPLLVDILASSDKAELVTDTLAVLASLAETVEGAHAILQTSSLPLITKILQCSTTKAGKEYCISMLLSLCTNGGVEAVAVLAKNPSLMGSLYSNLSDGNSHSSKKARSLMKILHNFHETSTSELMASAAPHERSVHVW